MSLFLSTTDQISIEVNAPRDEQSCFDLLAQLQSFEDCQLLFCSVSSHDFDACAADHSFSSLSFAGKLRQTLSCPIVLHLTCEGQSEDEYDFVLNKAHDKGIQGLFVVLGDNYKRIAVDRKPIFASVCDLLLFIQQKHADKFFIGVPVYPSDSDNSELMQTAVQTLKGKIQRGAQFAITQALYDHSSLNRFVDELRKQNVNLPICGGLLPVASNKTFNSIKKFGKIPLKIANEQQIQSKFDEKSNDQLIWQASLQGNEAIVKKSFESKTIEWMHIFTLNQIDASKELVKIIRALRRVRV